MLWQETTALMDYCHISGRCLTPSVGKLCGKGVVRRKGSIIWQWQWWEVIMICDSGVEVRSIPGKGSSRHLQVWSRSNWTDSSFRGRNSWSKVCKWATICWEILLVVLPWQLGIFLPLKDCQLQCSRSTDKLGNLGRKLKLFCSYTLWRNWICLNNGPVTEKYFG